MEAGPAARAAVFERSLGLCERCGTGLGTPDGLWEAHHRKLRARGGTWDLSNVAALCAPCHHWCHANPVSATAWGWLVPTHLEATDVAVDTHGQYLNGARVHLTSDGAYVPADLYGAQTHHPIPERNDP